MINQPQIPQDIEAEQAVLGSIIENNDLLTEVSDFLQPNSFFMVAHQHIYRAIIELSELNYPIDEVILGDQLKSKSQLEEVGGYAYIAELVECAPSTGNIKFYAQIVAEKATLRDVIKTSQEIGQKALDPEYAIGEILNDAYDKISGLSDRQIKSGSISSRAALSGAFQYLERVSENPGELFGIPTGFIDLDKKIGGLIPKSLNVLAGRPSMGKTALALNILAYVTTRTNEKGAGLFFSREMSSDQLALRLMAAESGVNSHIFKTGNIQAEDWDRLARATDVLSGANFYINESALTIHDMRTAAKKISKTKHGLALIVADYLQLFEGKGQNREQEIAYISRSCKAMAKDFNVPFILLSQLNREVEKRSNKRPMLSDLRESGAIEQDADIVAFIYRDEVYYPESQDRGKAEVIIGKNRDGPTGTVNLAFVSKYTKFANLSLGGY